MDTAKPQRTIGELIFLSLFLPSVILFYLIYKYPTWFVPEDQVASTFYWFGKSTSFWYMTVYTGFIVILGLRQFLLNRSPYSSDKNQKFSPYQRKKWISIIFSQLVFFYFIPYYLPYLKNGGDFFNDTFAPLNKNAYVYVYNGFTSMGGFVYIFIVVPLVAWFLGKRYCSWFCACGNLAEAAGLTKWGQKWVRIYTPRSELSKKMEVLQFIFLLIAVFFGLMLFLDSWNIFSAPNLLASWRSFQDFVVDFAFGAIIGVGAYPFFGTRLWCRYGCPLANLMNVTSKLSKSTYGIRANDKCRGINLCNTVCPMGIDIASYAHKDGVPIEGKFNLDETPCISCGGCIDICPVQALEFEKVFNPKARRA